MSSIRRYQTIGTEPPISVFDQVPEPPISLIFTHGREGGLDSPAMDEFSMGFAEYLRIFCFAGSEILKERVEQYKQVMEYTLHTRAIGGRSLGGRAAARLVNESTKYLVLISYPLRRGDDVRDAELLALPSSVRVIFVSGEYDKMLDHAELDTIREKMKCQTWRIVVRNATHGMDLDPEWATTETRRVIGRVVALWLVGQDEDNHEGEIVWDDRADAKFSGWLQALPVREKDEFFNIRWALTHGKPP